MPDRRLSSLVNTLITRSSHADDTLTSECGACFQRLMTLSFADDNEPDIKACAATTHERIRSSEAAVDTGDGGLPAPGIDPDHADHGLCRVISACC